MKSYILLLLIFVSILHADAQYWMQCGGSVTVDEAMSIAVDNNDNTYTIGYFTGVMTMDGNTVSSTGLNDIFIIKTNKAGKILWIKKAGGPNVDKGLSIAIDTAGNIAITGFFYGSATFDGQTISSSGQQDIFIAKYDASGTLLWVKSAGGTGSDIGNSVTFDINGNVIITGEFSGTCFFGSASLSSMNSSIDVLTAKYDVNGNFLWAKKGSAKYTDRGTGVSCDTSGNVYVFGMFSDTIAFDNTYNNKMYNSMFLIKYNALGQEQWFRWMGSGSTVSTGGIKVYGNDVNIAGSFTGTLYFFNLPGSLTLSSAYQNNVFVIRYNLQGDIVWKHADGSSSEVNATTIAVNKLGEPVIGGNFKCRFNDYSALYGAGIFCSIGYWDCYAGGYDNSGNLKWGRQFGSKQNESLHGIGVLSDTIITTTGSFDMSLYSTYRQGSITFYGSNWGYAWPNYPPLFINYCTDPDYDKFFYYNTNGSSDIFINTNIDLNRKPYDYFERVGGVCNRPFNDICINGGGKLNLSCPDTVKSCGNANLFVDLNFYQSVGPAITYLWNNGSSVSTLLANTSGYYSVKTTTVDGCFTMEDSVYFVSYPIPPTPLITDSKGINTNALLTKDIDTLCLPISIILTSSNPGNNTLQWDTFPAGINPVTVTSGGIYTVASTNSYGCKSFNSVIIRADSVFPPIDPRIKCLQDTFATDSIELCLGKYFDMLPFDTITNPNASPDTCIIALDSVRWTVIDSSKVKYSKLTYECEENRITPKDTGDYDFKFSIWIYRSNYCDTDSFYAEKNIHVIVHPIPKDSVVPMSVTGPPYMCHGDTAMLVASPHGLPFIWSTGATTDTIYVYAPGPYSVSIPTQNLTNAYGCEASITGGAGWLIRNYPSPNVSMIPSNGLICPNDSVKLICTGGINYRWQGPTGNIVSVDSFIYVNTPGYYYCIAAVGPGCDMVSNTVQVVQYSTPQIIGFPNAVFCPNDSVTLTVVTNSGSIIQWEAPFTGNNISKVVYQPGTYVCNVTTCGITIPLNYTVFLDSAVAQIYPSDPQQYFCTGDSLLLTSNNGMSGYFWLPISVSASQIYVNQPGSYSLITTSTYGCTDTAKVTINEIPIVLSPPLIDNALVCPGSSAQLIASGADTITWTSSFSYNSVFYQGPAYSTPPLDAATKYYLFTRSGICKSGFDSVTVDIDENCDSIVIPNVFTPNNDQLNDYFNFYCRGKCNFEVVIYNRWGNPVRRLIGNTIKWDGKNEGGIEVSDGVYYYVANFTNFNNEKKFYKGYVQLIR